MTVALPLYHFTRDLGSLLLAKWVPLKRAGAKLHETSQRPKSLRVVTWNVWFDFVLRELRGRHLIHLLEQEDPDIICLQEITPPFEALLRADAFAQKNWVMTSLEDQSEQTRFDYGTIIIARKALVLSAAWTDVQAAMEMFPESDTGRSLLYLELSASFLRSGPIRVGTVHLDYTPDQRASEFQRCIARLSSTPDPSNTLSKEGCSASVLCGDTNIQSYSETQPLLDAGFVDSFVHTHPEVLQNGEEPDLFLQGITFRSAIRQPGSVERERRRRLDLMLVRTGEQVESERESEEVRPVLSVQKYRLFGDESISRELIKSAGIHLEDSEELLVFPSDHIGILVDLEFPDMAQGLGEKRDPEEVK